MSSKGRGDGAGGGGVGDDTPKKFGSLWNDLQSFVEKEKFQKIIKTANKILEIEPESVEALKCKAVALIHQSKFEDALALASPREEMVFETAYALYRLGRLEEVLKVLRSPAALSASDYRLSQLQAQVSYKLGDYDTAAKLYGELLASDPDSTELATNYSAAQVASGRIDDVVAASSAGESYEIMYNTALAHVHAGNPYEAFTLLSNAQTACETVLREEGFSDAEIANEVAILRVELAHTLQLMNYKEAAMQIYRSILKSKPSDEGVVAVASNNVACLKGSSWSRPPTDAVREKLSAAQREAFDTNHALLMLSMGKEAECRAAADKLKETYPDSPSWALVIAGLLIKQDKHAECSSFLDEAIAACGSSNSRPSESKLQLLQARAWLQENQGNKAAAASAYQSLLDTPGLTPELRAQVTASLVLVQSESDPDAAVASAAKLPELPSLPVSAADLEATLVSRSARRDEPVSSPAATASAVEKQRVATKAARTRKRTKHREAYLTKLRDAGKHIGPVDPERWLPRYQRSSFRRRRRRGQVTGGAQGGEVRQRDLDALDARAKAEKAKATGVVAPSAPSTAKTATSSSGGGRRKKGKSGRRR